MTTYTIEPLSRLSLLLAMQRAREDGFMHLFACLKTLYVRLHGGKSL